MPGRNWNVLLREAALPIAAVLLLVLAVAGTACAVSKPETIRTPLATPPSAGELTAADAELLRQISVIDERVRGDEQLLLQRLSGLRLDRAQLFEALSATNPNLDLSRLHEVAIQLGPVDSLGPDHERYIAYLRDIAAQSRRFQQIVETEDLVAVHQYAIDIMVARAIMLNEVSPLFCAQALVVRIEDCRSMGAPAGGDYGLALRTAFRGLSSQIGPRMAFFPTQYGQDEIGAATAALLEGVVSSLQRTTESVRALEPPLELRADHERIMRFLSESLILLNVSEPEQLDLARLNELLEDFATLTEETGNDLSATAKAIVSPFFNK